MVESGQSTDQPVMSVGAQKECPYCFELKAANSEAQTLWAFSKANGLNAVSLIMGLLKQGVGAPLHPAL